MVAGGRIHSIDEQQFELISAPLTLSGTSRSPDPFSKHLRFTATASFPRPSGGYADSRGTFLLQKRSRGEDQRVKNERAEIGFDYAFLLTGVGYWRDPLADQ